MNKLCFNALHFYFFPGEISVSPRWFLHLPLNELPKKARRFKTEIFDWSVNGGGVDTSSYTKWGQGSIQLSALSSLGVHQQWERFNCPSFLLEVWQG